MIDRQPILWHGSRARFESFEERSVLTRLYAHWTTNDPVLAALYAGHDGWVHPVLATDNVRLLDASGWPGVRPLHSLTDDDQHALAEHREALGMCDLDETPFGDSARTLAFATRPGYGGKGTVSSDVSWEGVVQEDEHDCENLNALLQSVGFDAVLCVDPLPGIIGDIQRRLAESAIRRHEQEHGTRLGMGYEAWIAREAARPNAVSFRVAAAALERLRHNGEPPIAVGFLHPESAVVLHEQSIPAINILTAQVKLRSTPLDVLQAICCPATVEALRVGDFAP